jgi:hypothetical protein
VVAVVDNVMKSLNDIFVEDLCKHHIKAINCEFENLLKGQCKHFVNFTEFASYLNE